MHKSAVKNLFSTKKELCQSISGRVLKTQMMKKN